jgi:mannosyltransferase
MQKTDQANNIQTSLIIPAYNESIIIEATLERLADYISKHKKSLGNTEVIVVAAGTDNTATLARKLKSNFDNLKVVDPGHKRGKGLSVRLGFDNAVGDVQIFMDADLATPIHHIKRTVQSLRRDSDIVIGVRTLSRIHPGKLRTLFSLGSNLITRLILFPRIKDTQCGYKGFRREVAQTIFSRQRLTSWGFDIELLQLAKENRFSVTQQSIPDWQEEREEGLRGDGLVNAGLKTFRDLSLVRLEAWARFANRHYKVLLALSMLFTFGLALWFGHSQSVWFDEGYSISLARRPISELLQLTSVDAHPPLYYLILKGWSAIFGFSEPALRSLSALLGALSIGAMFLLVKKLFRRSTAVMVLPFITLAPFLTRYNYEIRMYSLVMLIGIIATYLIVKAQESKKTLHWLLYGFAVAVGMYTLYMSAVIWIAHGIYILISSLKESSKTPLLKQKFWLAYGLILLLFAPYIPTLISQFQHSALPNITSRVTFNELSTILSFGLNYRPFWEISPYLTLGIFTFLVLLIKSLSANYRNASKQHKESLKLFTFVFLIPILFFALISLPPLRPYFMERYIAHFVIFGYALIGITVEQAWRNGKYKPALVLAILSSGMMIGGLIHLRQIGNFNFQTLSKPSAKYLSQEARGCNDITQTTVVADEPGAYIDGFYYYLDCDLRFYSQNELGQYGGYVPIRFSAARIDSNSDLFAQRVLHLRWESKTRSQFEIASDSRYELVKSTKIDKQYLDEYRLK